VIKAIRTYFLVCIPLILLGSGCVATVKHVPSPELAGMKASVPAKLVVADVGDSRDEEVADRISTGVSFWFPYRFYAGDEKGSLPASFFIADSLNSDLNKVGFASTLANSTRKPITADQAVAAGKAAGANYVVSTKITDGKTHFWGFIIIPFMEPVWTSIGFDVIVTDLTSTEPGKTFHIDKSDTEWRFAKVTIFDAVFDAAIFGRRWTSRPWSETVVSDALAEAVKNISTDIGNRKPVKKEPAIEEKTSAPAPPVI
jgi:hypothetical protein